MHIGDSAAGFFDDDQACGMVPDLFSIILAGRKTQVDLRLSLADDCVLALTIDAYGLLSDSKGRSDLSALALIAVTGLDAFAETRGSGIGDVAHANLDCPVDSGRREGPGLGAPASGSRKN